jgi:adenylate cyclase
MDDRQRLLRRLRAAGHSRADIERAEAGGRLPTLAVEAALGGPGRHTLTAVSRASGLPVPYLRDLLRAIGRPSPGRGQRSLSDEDMRLAKLVARLLEAGLPRPDLLEVARVISQGTAQTAEAVRSMVGDALLQPGDSEERAGLRFAEAAEELTPMLPAVFDYAFRGHLRDAIRRALLTEAERRAGRLAGTREVAVAFADLVDYTRLGERVPPEDVGRIASRLAELAVGAVEPPALLIKTIGDAAMFVSPDVPALVRTVLALRQSVGSAAPEMPGVRVGIAFGPATTRGGDWFGATVNLASRLTEAARQGQVLATEEVAQRAEGFVWRPRRRRHLKGIEGWVRTFSLEAAEGARARRRPAPPSSRRPRSRSARARSRAARPRPHLPRPKSSKGKR